MQLYSFLFFFHILFQLFTTNYPLYIESLNDLSNCALNYLQDDCFNGTLESTNQLAFLEGRIFVMLKCKPLLAYPVLVGLSFFDGLLCSLSMECGSYSDMVQNFLQILPVCLGHLMLYPILCSHHSLSETCNHTNYCKRKSDMHACLL